MTARTINWKDEYRLGIESIDLQHQYFLGLINQFIRDLASADHLLQQRFFAELNAYARFHFLSEENLMHRHGYPAIAEHEQHHRALIDQLAGKQGEFSLRQTGADEIIEFLQSWFLNHTSREDRLFANFLLKTR